MARLALILCSLGSFLAVQAHVVQSRALGQRAELAAAGEASGTTAGPGTQSSGAPPVLATMGGGTTRALQVGSLGLGCIGAPAPFDQPATARPASSLFVDAAPAARGRAAPVLRI